MSLISLAQGLKHASQNGYALGAFNVLDTHFLRALFAAAEAQKSPFIINIAEVHFKYVSLEAICAAIKAEAAQHDIPVVLNLDHGTSFDAIMKAIRLGFTSVMFDGSGLDYEENIRQTAEVVKMCHALGISVEAELGAVGGDEGGALYGSCDSSKFTDPTKATDFVTRTGIDALAVAIGNVHGKYRVTLSSTSLACKLFVNRPACPWFYMAAQASVMTISVKRFRSASTKLTSTPACLKVRWWPSNKRCSIVKQPMTNWLIC